MATLLQGGSGNDVHLIQRGPTRVSYVIQETGGIDEIRFTDGVYARSLLYSRLTTDLIISDGYNDVRIEGQFPSTQSAPPAGPRTVERLRFDDGTTIDLTDASGNPFPIAGPGSTLVSITPTSSTLSITEGDPADDRTFQYRLFRTGDLTRSLDVGWTLEADTGDIEAQDVAGNLPRSGIATFAPGSNTAVVSFRLLGDSIPELGGSVLFSLKQFSGGARPDNLFPTTLTTTIFDNDTTLPVGTIDSRPPSQIISGTAGDDDLQGGRGNDTISGLGGNDLLRGNDGNDTLYGGDGNDGLLGGKGNDVSDGGAGDDTFFLGVDVPDPRDGDAYGDFLAEQIIDGSGTDTLNIETRIGYEGLRFLRYVGSNDLYLDIDGPRPNYVYNVVIRNQFGVNTIDRLYVYPKNNQTGGTTLNLTAVGLHFTGTYGDDTQQGGLGGTAYNDTIEGLAGNDDLHGGAGDDTYVFDVGAGTDTISEGSEGGVDTLRFGAGIGFGDLAFYRSLGSTTLTVTYGQGDRVTLYDQINPDGTLRNGVERLAFADGGTVQLGAVGLRLVGTEGSEGLGGTPFADAVTALGGNDTVYAYGGDDVIDAGTGDDVVEAGAGNDQVTGGAGNDDLRGDVGDDTYVFDVGAGTDSISEGSEGGVDTLRFGGGLGFGDLAFYRQLGSTTLTINYGQGDRVILYDQINPDGTPRNGVERLAFADGGTVELGKVGLRLVGTEGSEGLGGTPFADTVTALDGNDTIYAYGGGDAIDAGEGNDYVDAAAGNDQVTGGAGDDTLIGGAGDDTYVLGVGDGADTVSEGSDGGVDTLRFGTGINFGGLTFYRALGGTTLTITYGQGDQVVLPDQINPDGTPRNGVERLAFSDGGIVELGKVGLRIVGTQGNEGLGGTPFADAVTALGGNDTVYAYGGDDRIDAGAGDDYVDASAGNDQVTGGTGNDTLIGGDGNDTLVGGTGNDNLDGGAGDDLIDPGPGSDVVNAGAGADTLRFGTGINFGGLTFYRALGSTTLTITYGQGNQVVLSDQINPDGTPRNGVERLVFAGGGTVELDKVGLRLVGTGGSEGLGGTPFADTVTALDGNDTVYAYGGDDRIDAGAGDDYVDASAGNDQITGGAGNDTLIGGAGDDTYVFASGSGIDTVQEGADGGVDTLRFGTGINFGGLTFYRALGSTTLTITYGQGNQVVLSDQINPDGTPRNGVERLVFAGGGTVELGKVGLRLVGTEGSEGLGGTPFADAVTALGGNDTVYAYDGDDRIDAGAGDDYVDASAGNDQVMGGTGNDTLIGGAGDDTLVGGTGNDNLDGGAGDDLLDAGSGSDVVSGGDGADMLRFGTGVNFGGLAFYRALGSTTLTITYGSGDQVVLSDQINPDGTPRNGVERLAFSDGSTVELGKVGLRLVGTEGSEGLGGTPFADAVTALDGNDTVYAYGGDDVIDAGEGNDYVDASAGNDQITGGAGDDTLIGGAGDDTYLFASGSGIDTVQEGADGGLDTLRFGAGVGFGDLTFYRALGGTTLTITYGSGDQVVLSDQINPDGTPRNGVERLVFADGSAVELGKVGLRIIGTPANEGLGGTPFADTITALGGNDTVYAYGGDDRIDAGAGDDYVDAASGNDQITGGTGNDTLIGGAGDDTLIGGTGNDTLSGGTGDDIYYVDAAFDAISETAGEGTDQVYATVASYTLGNNIENLIFIGTGAFTGIGNILANILSGGAGADTLIGGGGRDTLTGSGGADLFKITTATDSAVDGGADLITDFATADGDRIDFSAIDADSTLADDQAFSFIGSGAFTGARGEVRAEFQTDGNTHVFGTVGGGTPNFEVVLAGSVTLQASNFVL